MRGQLMQAIIHAFRTWSVIPLLTIALIGVVAGAVYARTTAPKPHLSTGWGMPQPQNYEELDSSSNVIVVGKVGPVVAQGTFGGYDEKGNMIGTPTQDIPPVGYVDYEVKVESVMKDDGTLVNNKRLILRMNADRGSKPIDAEEYFPASATGDHHLFFLTMNPDKQTYGFHYGPWSRLMIDGQTISYSDGKRSEVKFAKGVKPADFVKQTRDVVSRRKG